MSVAPSDPRGDRPHPELVLPTLRGVLDDLGIGLVEVLAAPKGLGIGITGVGIHDPDEALTADPGEVLLAVGTPTDAERAVELVRDAGDAGVAAVLMKARGATKPRLVDAAERAGVALVAVPVEMSWSQLHARMRTLSAPTSAGVAGGLPVGDLFALANAVAAMVGGPVTIEDPHSTVLAYSSLDEPIDEARRQTILGRRVPETWIKRLQELGVFRRLWTTDEVVRFVDDTGETRPRMAVAVRAGGELLGSIWVAEGSRPFGPDAEDALHEAARMAALHFIRHRASEDLERRHRAEVLRAVLEGRSSAAVMVTELGLEPKGQYTVMGFELQAGEDADASVRGERAVDVITVYCEAFRLRSTSVAIGRIVYALLPSDGPAQRDRLLRLATDIVERTEGALRVGIRAAIGATVDELDAIPGSRVEVDRILRILAQGPSKLPAVARIEDVRNRTILLQLKEVASRDPALRAGKLAALVDHDTRRGTAYVDTLRAYLAAFGDIPAAAAAVNVHPNTFRYRIRRLAEVSGIDLDDPDERLVVQLQLCFLSESGRS